MKEPNTLQFHWQGDRQFFIEFSSQIDPVANEGVIGLKTMLEGAIAEGHIACRGIEGCLPSYGVLAINVNLLVFDPSLFEKFVLDWHSTLQGAINQGVNLSRTVHIPLCYGGLMGPDLEAVCLHTHLSADEVIRRHASGKYRVYMLGFTPGFPYLGGLDPLLKTPRLKVPRIKIPKGSVGIADSQTGIYPLESPGGWQIIGRTPLNLFDIQCQDKPALLEAGDTIVFVPIDENLYLELERNGGTTWNIL